MSTREVHAGKSHISCDDGFFHFGLGPVTAVDRIEVRWPDGESDTCPGPAVDRLHAIVRGGRSRRASRPRRRSLPGSVGSWSTR